MRSLPFLVLTLAACAASDRSRAPSSPPSSSSHPARADSAGGVVAAALPRGGADSAPPARTLPPPPFVRALYVNRFAAQSPRRMARIVGWADSTEINGLVIDLKDEFGLNFVSRDSGVMRNAGRHGHIPDLRGLLDTLRRHHIYAIARLVTFKDPVAATENPAHIIRRPDGSPWMDKKGTVWVNPYDHAIWEYNIRIAEELTRLGFDEIQFDYIRFPEPYKSLGPQVFGAASTRAKPDVLADFLRAACGRVHTLGGRCTADIFGLVTTVPGALEVGQAWEKLMPAADVLLPMTYPSHYPRGSFGLARPNAEPYKVQYLAISRARQRNDKLGLPPAEQVRPWIQAFTLGAPPYGPEEIRRQKQGIYDAGYDGWVMWHPGSKYEPFLPALEKERVSHKKSAHGATNAAAAAAPPVSAPPSRDTSPGKRDTTHSARDTAAAVTRSR